MSWQEAGQKLFSDSTFFPAGQIRPGNQASTPEARRPDQCSRWTLVSSWAGVISVGRTGGVGEEVFSLTTFSLTLYQYERRRRPKGDQD